MTVENTQKRDALEHLVGSMSEGSSAYIEGMEAAGQRQLVASAVLPSDMRPARETYEAMGFAFGEPVEGDPLFVHAELPAGWTKQGSDHAMWSYVLDERGIRRVAVFYKAAFYDRGAHMHILRPGSEFATQLVYGDSPVADVSVPWDLLTAEERTDLLEELRSETHSGDELERARQALARFGGTDDEPVGPSASQRGD